MSLSNKEIQLFRLMVTDLVNVTSKMGPMLLLASGLTDGEWRLLRMARVDGPKRGLRKLRKVDIADRLITGLSSDRLQSMFQRMVTIAASFNSFELSSSRDRAELVVRQAQAWMGRYQEEQERRAEILGTTVVDPDRVSRDRQREELLIRFDRLHAESNRQRAGLLFESLLNDACRVFNLQAVKPFVRDPSGTIDQIDGGITVGGRAYTVECKWTTQLTSRSDIDGLMKKIERSHDPNMWGMLLSINGWAPTVVEAIRVDRLTKNVILMNGVDFRAVLEGHIDLAAAILGKTHHCTWHSKSFVPVSQLVTEIS